MRRLWLWARSPAFSAIRRLQVLNEDGAGRVRYGAMQSLRLLAARGMADADESADHEDPDFGVRFERQLFHKQLRTA
jgi:hypothetical protein